MVRVKVCGICDAPGAEMAVEAGADMLGFHFCSSERRVTPEEAKSIIDGLDVRPKIVGVFIDQDQDEVRQIAEFVDLDLLQLHGSESPGFEGGRPVIKVLKVQEKMGVGKILGADDWPDPIMLDSWSADQRGGTGKTWDWELARSLLSNRKVFIAGGLEPGNVGKVVSGFKPYGVDVSSGVEASIRVKDSDKMRAFVRAVRLAEALM
jgi:phosphoribosylanthranilate isomerase